MSSNTRRYRSSTIATAPTSSESLEILTPLLERFASTAASPLYNGFPAIEELVELLVEIQNHISATGGTATQDEFRHAHGFDILLDALRAFSGYYDPHRRSEADMLSLFGLLGAWLNALSSALRDHTGNRRFFRYRVAGGGWEALEQVIASIGLGGVEPDPWVSCHVFGKLLAFALDDDALDLLCQATAMQLRPRSAHAHKDSDSENHETPAREQGDGQQRLLLTQNLDSIAPSVREVVDSATTIRFPEILRAVVSFWMSIPRQTDQAVTPSSLFVLETVFCAISLSAYNRSAVHSTGVLSQFLRFAFTPSIPLVAFERQRIIDICRLLMTLGVNQPSDTQFLLSAPGPEAADFCLDMMSEHTGPSFFQFDLSLHGHSSLELATLGRSFPPQNTAGYTFTAWIRIEQFDPTSHTTIFGIFDTSQTCFVLMYLERDTHNFILQTSVVSSKPSVRFKSITFRENLWYHIGIVHRRPKAMMTSKASLYVNGEFAEQSRCHYPLTPPLSNHLHESFASFHSNRTKTNPVQVFLGTPRELSGNVGGGEIHSRWSLASAHMFADVLSDDYLAVHHGLGPRYQGNYQDSLGGFQTYETSASLGLRNEITHPGRGEKSDILRAIREKASLLAPESKILLSILPAATFPENVQFLDTGLLRSLPRNALRSLFRKSSQEGAPLAVNCAVPNLADAILSAQGIASFRGTPILAVPSHLDENLWRLGGFTPLGLKLLERASTADETVRAIEIMFRCIRKSWRNSEAMERDNGYGILGMLLRYKLGHSVPIAGDPPTARLVVSGNDRDSMLFRILSLTLDFVGYNHANPIDSFIVNPLAYRILLIDLDIWRKSASRVQELYYKQFLTFSVNSKHHEFNSRRLTRMRIVKRLLDAMKDESISENVSMHFMRAFEVLVRSNMSQEVMRSLSLYITYAFYVPPASQPRTPRTPRTMTSSPACPEPLNRASIEESVKSALPPEMQFLSKRQLGKLVLGMYGRILCEKENAIHVKKFAKTVTDKWLLHLLMENDDEIVTQSCRLLARLLVIQDAAYVSDFTVKYGGFTILANRLKRFWGNPRIWFICFSIFFGYDTTISHTDQDVEPSSFLPLFNNRRITCSESLVVIISMLQQGLNDIAKRQDDDATEIRPNKGEASPSVPSTTTKYDVTEWSASEYDVLLQVIQFLLDLQRHSVDFRDFMLSSEWVRMLLAVIYPCIVSVDIVKPEVELNSRDSVLSFEGSEVIIRPMGKSSAVAPIVISSNVEVTPSPQSTPPRGTPLRRASSFVLLTTQKDRDLVSPNYSSIEIVTSGTMSLANQTYEGPILDGILQLVLVVFSDQIWNRKDFSGLGLYSKVPPGFQEHQAYFDTCILQKILQQITDKLRIDRNPLREPRILNNISRLCMQMAEAIFEGWFIDGAESMIDFCGSILEYLQRPDISRLKSVRLCSRSVSTIRDCLLKIVLLRLSNLDKSHVSEEDVACFVRKLFYWQTPILGCFGIEDEYLRYLKLFWYQLYMKLTGGQAFIRTSASSLMRIIMVQKPDEFAALIRSCMSIDRPHIQQEFEKLTEVDDDQFVLWVDQHRPALDELFFGNMAKTWEDFVNTENKKTLETAKTRLNKRRDRLKAWHIEVTAADRFLLNHDMGNSVWMKNIFNSEHFKFQRVLQDQQDDMAYLGAAYRKMEKDLRRPGAVFSEPTAAKWKLDRTEGRNRMRLRLLPDASGIGEQYRSKAKAVKHASLTLKTETMLKVGSETSLDLNSRPLSTITVSDSKGESANLQDLSLNETEASYGTEDDFEFVDDPNDPMDGEDKNRKVMRRLEQGDQVQAVYNMSRITGLEACEGILIVGKDALYMMDNVFQCASGDIVNVWQAPQEERDPFTMVVTGAKTLEKRQNAGMRDQDCRHWKWHDVISFSKRRFLFRDVAIEIFFTDGRSYLLTMINADVRDEVYLRLSNKASHTGTPNSGPSPEDAWRLEAVKAFDESPQGFGAGLGSRIGTLFNSSPGNPVTRRWQKGDVSNFHYLMMVNTMAGRTFNDLTQYPVFPWVLADYTSEDLDLEDPSTFRDLSKPMGAQTQTRVSGFIESYSALQDIGETPFHYGTHYSSAMIVSSYLIRLPPFVQSYLLVQGDSFDHADRLFQSVGDAWASASSKNKSDVRELIPEFFCLPEFLTNLNQYDFGRRQSTGARVDHVKLPPWAKGDPKIFIAKHREALESPYVSENLHHWIDLIFGYKQRGEAAVENLNVFHHLSYAGASDLDKITDANERAVTAGVIHNFGQTPHQVFTKPHACRENTQCPLGRLDSSVFSLQCPTRPLLDARERVASLVYAPKLDRLLCATPFRLNFAPYDKYMQWGYADSSIRFFFSESRKPAGLSENLHIGQISCACFADSRTLITAGEDCVVSVYTVRTAPGKQVELVPRSSVFGHKTLVTAIAVSKSFSTFVTASADGQAFLWDLNQLSFIRKLPLVRHVECAAINNVSGDVLLCCGPSVLLYTLNGTLIVDQNLCGDRDDYVHSCAFYEGAGNEWLENNLIFTGHSKGKVNVWRKCVTAGRWSLEHLRKLDHVNSEADRDENIEAGITCITPMPTCLYTGDEDGKVYEWNLGRDR